MKTLDYYIKKEYCNNDTRYMSDELKTELIRLTQNCLGNIRERIFWLKNKLEDYPECEVCHVKLTSRAFISNGLSAYRKVCGKSCARKHPDDISKREINSLKRYGVTHPFKSEEVQSKRVATNLKKYGSSHPHSWGSEEFKQIIINKYGSKEAFHSNPKTLKKIGTSLINFNIVNGKTRQNISRIEQKNNVTCLTVDEAENLDREKLEKTELSWRHDFCGTEYLAAIIDGDINVCPKCKHGSSRLEQALLLEISKMLPAGETIIHRAKILDGKEIDIFLPSFNLGIEFNGIYWHSIKNADQENNKMNHVKKTELAKERNIQLIHISEHDWLNNREIVLSRLKYKLGLISNNMFGRNGKIREITKTEKKVFLDQNHLQGNCNSKINLGLFIKEKLVSVMTFSMPRFAKTNWEVIRFCSLVDTNVVGSASKLFKHFLNNYVSNEETILTYADRSWGDGTFYTNLGFTFDGFTAPSYLYANMNEPKILSRYQTQKHKLPSKIDNFNPLLSEYENMRLAGWFKIYDCGTARYILTK